MVPPNPPPRYSPLSTYLEVFLWPPPKYHYTQLVIQPEKEIAEEKALADAIWQALPSKYHPHPPPNIHQPASGSPTQSLNSQMEAGSVNSLTTTPSSSASTTPIATGIESTASPSEWDLRPASREAFVYWPNHRLHPFHLTPQGKIICEQRRRELAELNGNSNKEEANLPSTRTHRHTHHHKHAQPSSSSSSSSSSNVENTQTAETQSSPKNVQSSDDGEVTLTNLVKFRKN